MLSFDSLLFLSHNFDILHIIKEIRLILPYILYTFNILGLCLSLIMELLPAERF